MNNTGKSPERPFYCLNVLKDIGMVKLNACKYCPKGAVMHELWPLVKKGRVILIAFKHKPRRRALFETGIVTLEHASNHKARVKRAACIKS